MVRKVVGSVPGARKVARLLGLIGPERDRRRFLLEMAPKNAVCAEIGVHTGDFSARILNVARPAELRLIDPWRHQTERAYEQALYGGKAGGGQVEMDKRYEAVCQRFQGEIAAGRVVVHRGNSSEVLTQFPDGYFDWIYIDGNHLYEFVKLDLALSFRKAKAGGYIAGDDYGTGGWWQDGVKKAVDEVLRERGIKLVAQRNAQFVLQK